MQTAAFETSYKQT